MAKKNMLYLFLCYEDFKIKSVVCSRFPFATYYLISTTVFYIKRGTEQKRQYLKNQLYWKQGGQFIYSKWVEKRGTQV